MARYRAILSYDGTAYLGYQRQHDGQPTVQGEVEKVVAKLAQQPVTVYGAGRTDSGVHATGQVIAFDLNWRHETEALQNALNAYLPADIKVREVAKTDDRFHPRFAARRRTYEYFVYNAPVADPTKRLYSWHVTRALNLDLMNEAAALLVGVHDFGTFGTPPQGDSTVREIFAAGWQPAGDYLMFRVSANAFLYRMVRSLVGTLVAVGEQKWTVSQFAEAFCATDRTKAKMTAPAHGLFLVAVDYE